MPELITIETDYIKLDSLLKLANLVMSGGEAKLLIQEGQILVNGQVENPAADASCTPGDRIRCVGRPEVVLAAQ